MIVLITALGSELLIDVLTTFIIAVVVLVGNDLMVFVLVVGGQRVRSLRSWSADVLAHYLGSESCVAVQRKHAQ
jgi:hypothetical protein